MPEQILAVFRYKFRMQIYSETINKNHKNYLIMHAQWENLVDFFQC